MARLRTLTAVVEALEPILSDEQKERAFQFFFNLLDSDSDDRTEALRKRNQLERLFEESQLSGPDLARRLREPV